MKKRYFRAELQWVNGLCGECHAPALVARIPHERILTPAGNPIRRCTKCLTKHRRLIADRKDA